MLIFIFINKPVSLKDFTIFIISSSSSFEIINNVPDPGTGVKILLANGLCTFFTKGKPDCINGPRSLPRNPSNCPILDNWVFDYFVLADELLAKYLPIFEPCVLVNNDLCEKSHH